MIRIRQKGNFQKLTRFMERAKEVIKMGDLDKYGQMGVDALAAATPTRSGKTADSWYYKIEQEKGSARIIFCNSNVNHGVPIAIIIQYGHGTGTGGWVEGTDYINPVVLPLFEQIAYEAWKEVSG